MILLSTNFKENQMTDKLPPVPSKDNELVLLEAIPRKRGAPRGNKNALKHGFYSNTFSRKEIKRLDDDVEGEFRDEEEFLRVLIARTAESVEKTQLTHAEYLAALIAVSLAMGRIESIHRSRKAIFDKQSTIDKVWEELKYLPVEED
jgi:hypothetical protein